MHFVDLKKIKYQTYYWKKTNKLKLKLNNKQHFYCSSKEKICIICGRTFFSQGRINSGKTCSTECRTKHYSLYYKQSLIKEKVKKYHLTHLKERRDYNKKRELEEPIFKISHSLRSNFRKNLLLKFNENKENKFKNTVGYSYSDLKIHLEKQFSPNMNWGNYGKVWQVDHIIPLKWFKTKEQFIKKGWALKNLQPLESNLNLAKQDKYVGNPKTGKKVIYL